ncbi:MAG: tRNA dihydrouridine(20/20a) synthase DusA [Legionellales bacterium]|nr:tRNA dihydrouridine(20/20a) synthase DusA [Legionellales bacterium]
MINRLIAVAPMLDWTDRHFRYLMRIISKHVLLYSEMVTCGAVLHGDRHRLLGFHSAEHPVALQLGGADATQLAQCAVVAEQFGYDEVNLNVGCPSDRVQAGRFGACLMLEPDVVAAAVAAMQAVVNIPVTVKSRIGVDQFDQYKHLYHFVKTVAEAGCQVFIIHARKAWLQGLSPKQNREIPPLQYEVVQRLKQDFPQLTLVINGGITDLIAARQHHLALDGVMIGRQAYTDPYSLIEVDRLFYQDEHPLLSRQQVVAQYLPYIADQLAQGERLASMAKHLLGLLQKVPGAKRWRRYLSTHIHQPNAGVEVIEQALALLPNEV